MHYTTKVNELFKAQLADWPLAKANYGLLDRVKTRSLDFGTYSVLVQIGRASCRERV